MNIHIIKNAEGLKGKMLKNGCIMQIHDEVSDFDGIKLRKMFFYDLKKNENIELRPDIKKYNIVDIEDVKFDSKYVYFSGIKTVKGKTDIIKISVYRYDYMESHTTDIIYEFEESLEKYNNYMRTKIFVVNENYLIVQNEFLRANLTEDYEGYFDFELFMYDIKNKVQYKIFDEQLNQCGIMTFIPVTTNVCIIKTGYSLLEDNRYKTLKKEEAVLESVSFVNIGQMVSDILIGQQKVVMDTIDSVYYTSTIPYLKVDGKYICYSKVKIDGKVEEEIVFYNYATKDSLMCINNNVDDEMNPAYTCIMCDRPYIVMKNTKGYEFIDIADPKKIISLEMDCNIEYAAGNIVAASGQVRGLFGKKRDNVFVFSFPSMQMLHREKGRYEGLAVSNDGIIHIMTR